MPSQNSLASYPSLKGKRVFVTGGASGIGESIVTEFAAQGATVAFVDIATDAGLNLCERLAKAGYETPVFRCCDIRDIPALQADMRALAQQIGDFDVLVNNAGNDDRHQPEEVTLEYWDDRIAINQRPMFFTCQAVIAGMKKNGGGSIINLGSISWHIANGGYSVYTTTKAAVSGLTRGLARDLGPYNIRVNTVTPGWVMTERQMKLLARSGRRAGNRGEPVFAGTAAAVARCAHGDVSLPPTTARCVLRRNSLSTAVGHEHDLPHWER